MYLIYFKKLIKLHIIHTFLTNYYANLKKKNKKQESKEACKVSLKIEYATWSPLEIKSMYAVREFLVF